MAYIDGNKRISPLDINKNVTIGVAFPLDNVNMFKGTRTVKEQVKTNLINLLLTEPGERLYTPNYGVGLKKLIFQNDIDLPNLNNNINQQIQLFLPQISLINTFTEFIENENTLYIKIAYKYNLDGSTDAIQLNFNNCN